MEIIVRGAAEGVSNGTLTIKKLLSAAQLNGKCGLYAQAHLSPGATLNLHKHEGNTETYFILSGEGVYNDDGRVVPARVDDVFFCADGHSHAITNVGADDLVFMALIINS